MFKLLILCLFTGLAAFASCAPKFMNKTKLVSEFSSHLSQKKHFDRKIEVLVKRSAKSFNFSKEQSPRREFFKNTFNKIEEQAPTVWLYPASGFDVTLEASVPNLATHEQVFIHVDSSAFINPKNIDLENPVINYEAENLMETKLFESFSVTFNNQVWKMASDTAGVAQGIISRMVSMISGVRILKVEGLLSEGYRPEWMINSNMSGEKFYSHGYIEFDTGKGSALQRIIYINADINKHGDIAMRVKETSESISLNSSLLTQIDGVFLKGSQGVLSPYTDGNIFRDKVFKNLKKNKGLLIEGKHEHTKKGYARDHEEAWEAFQGQDKFDGESLVEVHTDKEVQMSYYKGARAIRFN